MSGNGATSSKKSAYLLHPKVNNDSLVQIDVPTSEIKRRINSFLAKKREEVNRENVIEFCHESYEDYGQSCARVDAVLTKRNDCKSHVKVHRVVNAWGPQLGKVEGETDKNLETTAMEETTAKLETTVNLETTAQLETAVKLKMAVDSEPGVNSEPGVSSETAMESETAIESETAMESETAKESETAMKSESETAVKLGTETESETDRISGVVPLVPVNVDERLINVEQYLKVTNDFGTPDIYARLRSLEERILFLEGISPEYADHMADRARVAEGNNVAHIPINKRRFSKYEMRRRLALLMTSVMGKKLKVSQTTTLQLQNQAALETIERLS